jgi:hypothetical protein
MEVMLEMDGCNACGDINHTDKDSRILVLTILQIMI